MFCRPSMTRQRAGAWWLLAALLALAACDQEKTEQKPIETVDVSPAIELDISEDVEQAPVKPSLVGVLPSSFPTDLPVLLPASLIDFGQTEGGERFVDLLLENSMTRMHREVEAALRKAGWSISGDARQSGATLSKGERRVTWRMLDAKPGTVCRYEY